MTCTWEILPSQSVLQLVFSLSTLVELYLLHFFPDILSACLCPLTLVCSIILFPCVMILFTTWCASVCYFTTKWSKNSGRCLVRDRVSRLLVQLHSASIGLRKLQECFAPLKTFAFHSFFSSLMIDHLPHLSTAPTINLPPQRPIMESCLGPLDQDRIFGHWFSVFFWNLFLGFQVTIFLSNSVFEK